MPIYRVLIQFMIYQLTILNADWVNGRVYIMYQSIPAVPMPPPGQHPGIRHFNINRLLCLHPRAKVPVLLPYLWAKKSNQYPYSRHKMIIFAIFIFPLTIIYYFKSKFTSVLYSNLKELLHVNIACT